MLTGKAFSGTHALVVDEDSSKGRYLMVHANPVVRVINVKGRSAITAVFYCEECQKETSFLPIHGVLQVIGISRSTVYYWMSHRWIHWKELPSGRRVICRESLSLRGSQPDPDLNFLTKNQSESVRNRPILSNPVG